MSSANKNPEPFKGEKGNIYKINLKTHPELVVEVPGFNERLDYGDMDWLVESIARDGIRVPAQGYTKAGVWHVTDGHRRLRAAKIAVDQGFEVVFLIQAEPKGYNEGDRLLDMLTRNSGKPFTMIEEARVFARLAKLNFSNVEIAQKTGRTITHVNDGFLLLEATPAVQTDVELGKVAATTVVNMQRDHSPEFVEEKIVEAKAANPEKKRLTPKDIPGAKSGRERVEKPIVATGYVADNNSEYQNRMAENHQKAMANSPGKGGDAVKADDPIVLDITHLEGLLERLEREWNPRAKILFKVLKEYARTPQHKRTLHDLQIVADAFFE